MSTALTVTTICENTAMPGLLGAWGLSILLETGDTRVLMDTGEGENILHNADLMNVQLAGIDAIVLSHGHSDHTGGLSQVLTRTGPIKIVAHPDVLNEKFSTRSGLPRAIGMPFELDELESAGALFTWSAEPVWLSSMIVTSGEIPMVNDFEDIHSSLRHLVLGKMEADPLNDDMATAIKTSEGLVVVLGCAHRGLINTINRMREIAKEDRVRAIIGGTHLLDASTQRLDKTIHAIKEMNPQLIACAHCTGPKAQAVMASEFGEQFVKLSAGVKLSFS